MKKINLILMLTIALMYNATAQVKGKWKSYSKSMLTKVQDSGMHPDSITITFRGNGRYKIDIYSRRIFPLLPKQPWKKYYFGQWKISKNQDSLFLYNNYEKWISNRTRQNFSFRIKMLTKESIELIGVGEEMLYPDDPNHIVWFDKTEQILLKLKR